MNETQTRVSIETIDDDINEANEQIFVVMLELVNATNPSLITTRPSDMFAHCFIIDNDRKYEFGV